MHAIANGQETPKSGEQRSAPRNIGQSRAGATGEFNE